MVCFTLWLAEEVRKEFPLMRKKIAIRDDTFRKGTIA